MKEIRFQPDDPRLTAYALGELSGEERAAVEAALREDPELQGAVDEIRAVAAQLEAALAADAVPRPHARSGVPAGNLRGREMAAPRKGETQRPPRRLPRRRVMVSGYDHYPPEGRSNLLRFPQVYYVVATAAAACVAVMVALRDKPAESSPAFRTIRHEIVVLPPGGPAEAPSTAGASLPIDPLAETTPAATAVTGETNPTPAGNPAFIAGDLSLIGQATHLAVDAWETEDHRVGARPLPEAPVRTPVFTMPRIELVSVDEASRQLRRTAEQTGITTTNSPAAGTRTLISEALEQPVAGPVVAGSTLPSVLPSPATTQPTSTITSSLPGSGDVIMLSPITVSADRATGFAMRSNTARSATRTSSAMLLDDRPFAPPGARFGRNADPYSQVRDNPFLSAARNPLSSFAVEVERASYGQVRRSIEQGSVPARETVRIEELLNYFPYQHAAPAGDAPFGVALEVAEAPWAPTHLIVRVALKAREAPPARRPAANLVFLLDVSGSMDQPNKLPLMKEAMRRLLDQLRADDRVAIVTYAGESGVALPSTPAAHARVIMSALDSLTPGGGSADATGIQLAYDIAQGNFVRDGLNRVILCTDGDFNLGPPSESELVRLIEEKTATGVSLTVLGLGMGNYKDSTLERLAAKGNGNHGYIATHREAEKFLLEEVGGTAVTVARDVKVQVEFNPATVASYRLLGYENRLLRREDFNADLADAGEIGAGQAVTALYEVVPVGAERSSGRRGPPAEELRYGNSRAAARTPGPGNEGGALNDELLTVKVRYKKPDGLFSFAKTLQFPLLNATSVFARASADLRFAAAVAQFGMILRGSPYRGSASLADVAAWAAAAATSPAEDPGGFRLEFVELVTKAQTLLE